MSRELARQLLETSRTIAVLGARDKPHQAGFYVGEYLARVGYTVFPVNPRLAGTRLFGATVVASLSELRDIDMVDVFRRSEDLHLHLDEILALRPRSVWLQLGIRDEAFCERLRAEGIAVVQDRCTLADHRSMGFAGPPR